MNGKCKRYCSVPQCCTYKSEEVSIHMFPKDKKLCKMWKIALKIGKPISVGMSVCSKHFLKEDFTISTPETKIRRLKKGVIPSQNLPIRSHKWMSEKIDRSKRLWLNKKTVSSVTNLETENMKIDDIVEVPNQLEQSEHEIKIMDTNNQSTSVASNLYKNYKQPLQNISFTADQSTQTEYKDFTFDEMLHSDKKLRYFTGVDNDMITTFQLCVNNIIEHNNAEPINNLRMRIILVLIKLKLNMSFVCLSVMFNLSLTTCSKLFYSTLELLAVSLKPLIYWPTKEEIIMNMPKCFDKYKNTRVVLDCTEIIVQKCKCLKCRIRTYSHYKGAHTYKFLIGITPSGLISFISAAYGGRATDKAIFLNENLIPKCDPSDAIMVDKGSLIEKECQENYLKLIRPPFLKKQKQFSKEDAEETADIARARVHVERAIQRIKLFKIVNTQIHWNMVPYIDDIMSVICALVNLSPPILGDDKF